MKRLLLLLLLLGVGVLLSPVSLRANEIDGIRSLKDLHRFMDRHVDRKVYRYDYIIDPNRRVDSNCLAGMYYKLDLDGNGLTDLVINGSRLLVVMDMGESYQVHPLNTGGEDTKGLLSGIDSIGAPPKLVIRCQDFMKAFLDTVVWDSGTFMEYNQQPDRTFDFDEIKFFAMGCYGKCPQFELTIRQDGSVHYHPVDYNYKTRDSDGHLTAREMGRIRSILGYMGLDRMDTAYNPSLMDAPDFVLEVSYAGRTKKIRDNGGPSTNSLEALEGWLMGIWARLDRE